MKVMSFNIWSDAPRNSSWPARRGPIADTLKRQEPELAGLQEATSGMLQDLVDRLPDYGWLGYGRDDGAGLGEHTPIFYRKDRFQLVKGGSFWLSTTPDQPGRGWDAHCCRIVTWAHLMDRTANLPLFHFNTHMDHLGRVARIQGALLLLRKIAEIAGDAPVVVTGDFNCRESSAPYRLLTGQLPFDAHTPAGEALRDALYESEQPPEGPRKTFRGLLSLIGFGRIDYIFLKNAIRTRRHVVLDDAAGASDHRPVMVELQVGER
jgi:endonuclease/exonuclease/phosphatase family metal-dependent hydrolase